MDKQPSKLEAVVKLDFAKTTVQVCLQATPDTSTRTFVSKYASLIRIPEPGFLGRLLLLHLPHVTMVCLADSAIRQVIGC